MKLKVFSYVVNAENAHHMNYKDPWGNPESGKKPEKPNPPTSQGNQLWLTNI
jgi:hypothetical protein